MINQSPCTDPLYPCTALTLAEKSAALDSLTRLLHRQPMLLDEAEAVKAAIRALRKATTVDDCRVRRIPVYGMGRASGAAYSQRGDDYLLEAQRVAEENPPNASDMPENAPKNPPETVEEAENPPKVPPKKRNSGWRC
jgi:hypothetical protein